MLQRNPGASVRNAFSEPLLCTVQVAAAAGCNPDSLKKLANKMAEKGSKVEVRPLSAACLLP